MTPLSIVFRYYSFIALKSILQMKRFMATDFSLFVRCSICHIIDNFCKRNDFTLDNPKNNIIFAGDNLSYLKQW